MTRLIVACLFPFTGSWSSYERYVDGGLIKDNGATLIVDLSQAAKELHIGGEDYSRVELNREDCVLDKTAFEYNQERLKTYSADQLIHKKRGEPLP